MEADRERILVADALEVSELAPLERAGLVVEDRRGIEPAELLAIIPDYAGLLVRSRTRVTAELLQRAGCLRAVGRAGSGVDNIDTEAATACGVLVMNTPGGNTVAAAELTIALLLALARHVPAAAQSLAEGRWERSRFVGVEVSGKILGVVGLGRIGREVAQRARGLGMKILGYDPLLPAEAAEGLGVEPVTLQELVARADFLTVHVPRLDGTRHLINADLLSQARPGLRLLNVARGGIVDEQALLEALESGQVAGAALDVFTQEPPSPKGLLAHPHLIATPHLGASTLEAQKGVARKIAEQLAAYLQDGVVENAVNMVGWDAADQERLDPWLRLARRLGAAAAGLAGGAIDRVVVTYFGELGELPREPVMASVLKGVLEPFVGGRLTLVNAAQVAREHAIAFAERVRSRHKSFQSLLQVAVQGRDGRKAVWGTIFGRSQLRIVRAFGFNIDAIPEGHMLFVANEDQPGIIGHIGRTLAAARINIANMSVGRDPRKGHALAVLNLDQAPDAEVLAALRGGQHIRWVRHLTLEQP